jgi:transposase-like protein
MKNVEMTELQRQSLEHFDRARREGLSVKAYARAHGISAQQIYDTVGRLRRRDALPGQAATSGKFIISRTGGDAMKLIIEARVECTDSDLRREPFRLAVLDRIDDELEQLGLTLEEGLVLLAAAQSALISSHTEQWLATEDYCRRCCTPL